MTYFDMLHVTCCNMQHNSCACLLWKPLYLLFKGYLFVGIIFASIIIVGLIDPAGQLPNQ